MTGRDRGALRAFLRTPHAAMPDLRLTPDQTDDAVAYVLSLKGRRPGREAGRGVGPVRVSCGWGNGRGNRSPARRPPVRAAAPGAFWSTASSGLRPGRTRSGSAW